MERRGRGSRRLDLTAMGQAALKGWPRRVGGRVSGPLARRTGFTPEEIEAFFGLLFFVWSAYRFMKSVRGLIGAGRAGAV